MIPSQRMNLIKERQNVYTGNYKTSLKETKQDLNKSEMTSLVLRSKFNIKIEVSPKLFHRFNAIPIKIPVGFFFTEIDEQMIKFILNSKGPRIAKRISKKSKFEDSHVSISKLTTNLQTLRQ